MSDNTLFLRALRFVVGPAFVLLAIGICAPPSTADAQTLYGSVTGSVVDGSGAAVPGAAVSIKDDATGLELTAVTDSTGTYTIRNVTGGTYTPRASLQGFKEFVQTGIPVAAGSIVRINGRLEVGALANRSPSPPTPPC